MRKLVLLIILSAPLLHAGGTVFVLCYHSFMGKPGVQTDIPISDLSNQMLAIKALGYRFVSFNDIVSNRISGAGNVLITVDDGHNTMTNAFKYVFDRMGIRPLLFIYPALTGNVGFSVTYDDLRRFMSNGAAIGSHGYNHLYVNKRLLDSDPVSFFREIDYSRKVLERRLGVPIDVFSHPFGISDSTSRAYLDVSGYNWAFTINHGLLRVPLRENPDQLALPRFMVTRGSWPVILSYLADGWKAGEKALLDKPDQSGYIRSK